MALSGATTPGQGWTRSNGNEGELQIPQIFKSVILPTHCLVSYLGHSLGGGDLPLVWDAADIFNSLSWLDWATEIGV